MITPEVLRGLKPGDVLETGYVLEGLAPDEPLVLRLDVVNREAELFTFAAHYFDVPIGVWVAKIQDEKVIWVENKRR